MTHIHSRIEPVSGHFNMLCVAQGWYQGRGLSDVASQWRAAMIDSPLHTAALRVTSGEFCSDSGIESSHLIEISTSDMSSSLTVDCIDVTLDFCLCQQLLIRVSLLLWNAAVLQNKVFTDPRPSGRCFQNMKLKQMTKRACSFSFVIDTSICRIPAWCRAVGEAQPARTIQMSAACEQGYVSNRKILEGITQCGSFYRGKTVKHLKFPLSPSKKLKATNNEYAQRRSQSSSIGKKNLNQGSNWGKPRGGTE